MDKFEALGNGQVFSFCHRTHRLVAVAESRHILMMNTKKSCCVFKTKVANADQTQVVNTDHQTSLGAVHIVGSVLTTCVQVVQNSRLLLSLAFMIIMNIRVALRSYEH